MNEKTRPPPPGATELLWSGQIKARPYWTDVPLLLQGGTRYYLRATEDLEIWM